MTYIESKSLDPYYNLALEQFVFDELAGENSFFMLWQNHNAIILGKHQNTLEEINAEFVKEHNITVARRLSGGGAVYHDLGNLNFTFIIPTDAKSGIDFSVFCKPIQKALCSFGVPVEILGRNDMYVEGKKFSGNAQYLKQGKVMHHGTILYDSDLGMLSKALIAKDKIESKAVKSVRSTVTNIRPYMKLDMTTQEFWVALKDSMIHAFNMDVFDLAPSHYSAVEELKEKVYAQWAWNYGNSPPYTMRKARRFEGCGKIEIFLDMGKDGKIRGLSFFGDFFGSRDPQELGELLAGHHLEYHELKATLKGIEASQYFHSLDTEAFLSLLFE